MSTNFFQDALRQAMTSRHFNQAQLAEFLRVDPAYVSRWLKGSSPRIDQMRAVLIALGWDLDRARPDYDAFNDALAQLSTQPGAVLPGEKGKSKSPENVKEIKSLLENAAVQHKRLASPPVENIGILKAETATLVLNEAKPTESFESLSEMFPPIDFAANELVIVTVEGDELAPVHTAGTRLVLRKILKPNGVPNDTQVAMEPVHQTGTFHLRRLVRVEVGRSGRVDRLMGLPLTDRQDYLFFKPREVRLAWAVVGAIEKLA